MSPEGCVENGPAVRRRPNRSRVHSDMLPPTASPARTASQAAHFERNDIIVIEERVGKMSSYQRVNSFTFLLCKEDDIFATNGG
jgi:hypothetical protein